MGENESESIRNAGLAGIPGRNDMTKCTAFTGMRLFIIIWAGQLVSLIGSGLTSFSLGVWGYQTAAAVSQIPAPVLAGVLVALIQIRGVLLLDFVTFLFAMFTLSLVRISQPAA